jgi:signal transduction histidine kinase
MERCQIRVKIPHYQRQVACVKSELADFIEHHADTIVARAVEFARSVAVAPALEEIELRDHLPEILVAMAEDLRSGQTLVEAIAKSEGRGVPLAGRERSAAGTHALHRAHSGYSISHLVSEYRALRASVLHLWAESPRHAIPPIDVTRFNEAVDQAIAESVHYYAEEVERWRNIFLGVLGHDLRNPLNAILLSSEFIAARAIDGPVAVAASRAIRSGEHMRDLLDRLLVYNRAQLGRKFHVELENADLADVCRDQLDLLRTSLPEAHISFEGPAGVQVVCDASRIREAVANLVSNAHKYGERGGEIRVHLRPLEDLIELAVSNSGSNIPLDVVERIFDPLRRGGKTTGEQERLSMGLGLFVVKQVAIAHGGDVAVESSDGTTTFTLQLPRTSS